MLYKLRIALYDAVLFDLDGVITDTAKVHALCWKKLFDEYFQADVFHIDGDYKRYVDGKPRYEGVKSFLESKNVHLPYGTQEDLSHEKTVCGLGNKKNELFHAYLKNHPVDVYEDAIRFLHVLRSTGRKTAIVSSSKNCKHIVRATGLSKSFDAFVDGTDLDRLGLQGKPKPDMFIEAARQLGCAVD